jgi:ribosomal protein S18 acetylase RimI-like enzyme
MSTSSLTPDSPPVTIREMELEDLAAVFALGEKLFTADLWPYLYRTWDEYELVGIFSTDGETCLVADQDGEIVGFALGSIIDKRNSAWVYGYLVWLGVDQTLKGQGIGKRLVETLTDLFIGFGARMMLCDTDGDNEAAIRFFEGQGFGNHQRHVYLSRNLTSHPTYVEQRQARPAHPGTKATSPTNPKSMSLPDAPLNPSSADHDD